MKTFQLGFIFSLFIFAGILRADNWPSWRGVFGTGQSTENKFPTKWAKDQNVLWRLALPERGNSSPIVWEDRVFVTQAVDATKTRQLWCINRKTGKLIGAAGRRLQRC